METLSQNLSDITFADRQSPAGLAAIDQLFLQRLPEPLQAQLREYRANALDMPRKDMSLWLIELATHLERFVAELLQIEPEAAKLRASILANDPIFAFKKHFVLREAKRQLKKVDALPSFASLDAWLSEQVIPYLQQTGDIELAVATFANHLLAENDEAGQAQLIAWCTRVLSDAEARKSVADWVSFHLPQSLDHQCLIPVEPAPEDTNKRLQLPPADFRERDGFSLTDPRMTRRQALDEIHYCVYCHKNDGDFCSKGFPVKRSQPELGLKTNPAGEVLTGCPLEEKISEMQTLKKDGYSIAALAMVMVDNPMCPATGHRICNDCMQACIYQKQDPVDIPQAETRILMDVLELPWGVEIYDLLTKWNPLRQEQWLLKPYNGQKVLVMGMGPAGFTMAHHLTMAGCAVLGCDGLKIEALPPALINGPIKSFDSLKEDLADRVMAGFGGVAEYGITVRWDKNFLKLIYLTLMRRQYFQVAGNVRFGGTLKVDDVWRLGFDHLTLAVGAGLPKELPIPGSLAPGMRQANDFLMALQLTGAAKQNSLANLQLRLPVVVIGGGLTGVDAATEAQAYYIVQIEKVLCRYEQLTATVGEARVREQFQALDLQILDEMLQHARLVRQEREQAAAAGREPEFIGLLRRWGGVTIAYRRSMQESPAYRSNHEELHKALEEGLYYAEGLEPKAVMLDEFGQVKALRCRVKYQDADGAWHYGDDEQVLPARSILVATGAKPNIAYEYEHRGTFNRVGHRAYQTYVDVEGELQERPIEGHCKTPDFGPFTSYAEHGHRVSFIGDTHPVFHGSVVKAIAAAKRIYPAVLDVLPAKPVDDYAAFAAGIEQAFAAHVVKVERLTPDTVNLVVQAPLAAKQFLPAQIYRLQNYERDAERLDSTLLQSEALALIAAPVAGEPQQLSFIIREQGVSSRLISRLRQGQPLAVMGPTGAKCHVDPAKPGSILIMGDWLAAVYLRSIGPALKAAGYQVMLAMSVPSAEAVFCQQELESLADVILWNIQNGDDLASVRATDHVVHGELVSELQRYAGGHLDASDGPLLPLDQLERVYVMGDSCLLKRVRTARREILRYAFAETTKFIASVHGPMQCMLKGVCAQCLQWQIDPETGKRTKAVYACSWQDQPMEMIDMDNINERLSQNRMLETLSTLWLDKLLATQAAVV